MIRKAVPTDIDAVYKLYRSFSLDPKKLIKTKYLYRVQTTGFFVDTENRQSLLNRLTHSDLFNVYEIKNKIVGFINITHEIYFPENADNIIWFNLREKNYYFHSPETTVLHLIVSDRLRQNRGIASKLLEFSLKEITSQYQHLFSIITLNPTNIPSLIFHLKHGFRRSCVTQPKKLFGIKNYQSLLLYKELK